ncbi:hypothetical protein ABFS82_12G061900 [Erythranthe guttata]
MKKCWKSPCSWVVVIQGQDLCMLHFGKCQPVLTASGLLCFMQDASLSSTGFMKFLLCLETWSGLPQLFSITHLSFLEGLVE